MKKKAIIIYATAGGGHLAVAKSLEYQFKKKYPDIDIEMVNILHHIGKGFYKNGDKTYKFLMAYAPIVHELMAKVLFTKYNFIAKLMNYITWKISKDEFSYFIENHKADLYITTYHMARQIPMLEKALNRDLKHCIITTDIAYCVSPNTDPECDLQIIPSKELYEHGKEILSTYKDKIEIMGLPIGNEYFNDDLVKGADLSIIPEAKDKQKILILSGGEGQGRILELLKFLDFGCHNISIAVATGKNLELADDINTYDWRNEVIAFGWTPTLKYWYNWADLAITKAGPTTIWECMKLDKPMIIYSWVHGQEDGNVEFAEKYGRAKYIHRFIDIVDFITKTQKEYGGDFKSILQRNSKTYDEKLAITDWGEKIVDRIYEKFFKN